MHMWSEIQSNGKVKYCERYTDPLTMTLKKVSVTLEKDTAANRRIALTELNRKIEDKTSASGEIPYTYRMLFNKYIEYQTNHVKPSTLCRNRTILNRFVKMIGEDIFVDNTTAYYIRTVMDKYLERVSTKNTYLTRLKAMLNWGYENELIKNYELTRKLKPYEDKERKIKSKNKYLEPEELKKLLDYMKQDEKTLYWYHLTLFLVSTGLRIGEALPLNNNDIDNVIHVNKTFDPNNKIITSTKTSASERDVFIQKELKTVIREIRLHNNERMLLGEFRTERFFFDNKGKPLTYDAYRKYLRITSAKAIGRSITPHIMRHTHASLLIAKGVDLDTITRRLGHEGSKVTKEIYIHVTKELLEKDNMQIENVKFL